LNHLRSGRPGRKECFNHRPQFTSGVAKSTQQRHEGGSAAYPPRRPSARIPNLPGIVGGALKSPGGVDEFGEIGARAPVEVELGARIVQPIGRIGAGYVDRAQALRRLR